MKDFNPPLPKPAIKGPTGTGAYFDGFTEAQLLAYRAEVIEMCAKECELRARTNKNHDYVNAAIDCSVELRRLK